MAAREEKDEASASPSALLIEEYGSRARKESSFSSSSLLFRCRWKGKDI
jgi:hypothetical protein